MRKRDCSMGRGRSLGSVMPSVGSGRYSPGVGRDFAAFFVASFVAAFFAEPATAVLVLGATFFMAPFTKSPT